MFFVLFLQNLESATRSGLSPSHPHLSRGIRNKTRLKKNLSNKSNSSKRYNVFILVRGVGVETRGGEGKSIGPGNASVAFGTDRRLGDSANREARARFATVVSDWTIARFGRWVDVRGDEFVSVSVAIVFGE